MHKIIAVPALAALLVLGSCAATGGTAHASDPLREQIAANIKAADVNADSALTLSEFTTLVDLNAQHGIGRAAMIKRTGRYDQVFNRLDTNRDGLLTRDEVDAQTSQ